MLVSHFNHVGLGKVTLMKFCFNFTNDPIFSKNVSNNLAFLKYAHLGMIFVFIEIIIYDSCVNDQLVTSSSYQ